MFTFIAAVFFLLITPGPGVLTTAGVGSAFGRSAGRRYVLGLFIGTNLVALAVVTGVAGIMFAIPALRLILLVVSALYLLYLAARIAWAGSTIAFIKADKAPGIINGILLQTINPKAYVVNTTLFTGFVIYPDNLLLETLIKFVCINAIWIPVHLIWLEAGVRLRELNLAENKQRAINIAMAFALVVVVVLAVGGAV